MFHLVLKADFNLSNINYIVYLVTSPSGKHYVGITKQLFKDRIQKHYSDATSSRRTGKFQKAINKYSQELKWEIIDTASSWLELCNLEKYYIQKYNSYKNGYNCTLGGEGNIGWKPSDEVKEKMSLAQKGRILTDEHKKKLSEAKFGKKYGPRSNIGRDNLAIGQGATEFKVYKKDTLEYIGTWINRSECARYLNIDKTYVQRCLKHPKKYPQAKGYIFISSNEEGGVTS